MAEPNNEPIGAPAPAAEIPSSLSSEPLKAKKRPRPIDTSRLSRPAPRALAPLTVPVILTSKTASVPRETKAGSTPQGQGFSCAACSLW